MMTKILEHVDMKILGVFNCGLLGESIPTDNVLPKKILIVAEVMLVTGFASTHFVKYSIATMVKV
jgi:hypothetical protein